MTLPQADRRCTPEEYLRRERDSHTRHEYYHGEVFAMSGGTPEHSLTAANVIRALGNRLEGKPCRVYDSNLRVRVPRSTLYTYPDVSIVCGPLEFDPLDTSRQTVINPTMVVEVLSPSTESWDRGGKFDNYRLIDSLREYVLVRSDSARVESFLRQPDGRWLFTVAVGPDAAAQLTSIQVELPLAEVYRGVELSEQPNPSQPPA
jgi:Uma2 family endonuclease